LEDKRENEMKKGKTCNDYYTSANRKGAVIMWFRIPDIFQSYDFD